LADLDCAGSTSLSLPLCHHEITGSPQYTLDITGWKARTEVASDGFKLEILADAKKLRADQVLDLDDVPGLFKAKGVKLTMYKRIGVLLLAVIIWSLCLELGEQFTIPGLPSFVSTAEAIVGPPDADEFCGRRATDRASLCRGCLLLLGYL
jgi:hypothetical protein